MAALGSLLKRPPRYGIGAPAVPHRADLPTYLRITDISERGQFSPEPAVSVDSALSGNYLLADGELVVARTGNSVGKSYRYRSDDGPLVFAGFLMAVTPDPARLDPRYLEHYLQTNRYWNWIQSESMRSGQPGINARQLASMPVEVPPIDVQRSIARQLCDVDHAARSIEINVQKKRDIKQGLMQELLTGRTRLPGFAQDWVTAKLGSVAKMGSGGTPPSSVSRFYGGGIPWVSISDMTRGGKYIRRTESSLSGDGLIASAAKLYEPDVVLYAMYASLGECSLAVGRVSSSQAILGISTGRMLDREFLYYWLQLIKPQVKLRGQQGTQSNLNAGMVRDFDIPLPERSEQVAISSLLRDSDAEIEALERRLEATRAVKQGMMQELLSGKTQLVPAADVA